MSAYEKGFEEYWKELASDDLSAGREGFFIFPEGGISTEREYLMPEETVRHLLKISSSNNAALYIVLLSAIGFLLGRYANAEKVAVGVPGFKNREGFEVNETIPLLLEIDENLTMQDWIRHVREKLIEAQAHLDGNIEEYLEEKGLTMRLAAGTRLSLRMEGDFNTELRRKDSREFFEFAVSEDRMSLKVSCLYQAEKEMDFLVQNIILYFQNLRQRSEERLSELEIISSEERRCLESFNETRRDYDFGGSYYALFQKQCRKTPDRIAAVQEGRTVSYEDLDKEASRLAGYLLDEAKVKKGDFVAILYQNSIEQIIAAVAALKSGACFIPLDIDLPKERVKFILEDSRAKLLIFPSSMVKTAQELLWECEHLERIFCLDSEEIEEVPEREKNWCMNKELWEYIGETSDDDISLGGWMNSYTGEYFSEEEMSEYSRNVQFKLTPFLSGKEKVLEIGCGSGLTMFPLARRAGTYHAIDLSETAVEKNRRKAAEGLFNNIRLDNYAAHEVAKLDLEDVDITILNSVVQCFSGHNYLKNVLRDVISMMKEDGVIFIGDVMDLERKKELEGSLKEYKSKHPSAKTKTDWGNELFLSKKFFRELPRVVEGIGEVEITPKIHTIANELTDYRYDVLLKLRKGKAERVQPTKFCHCLRESRQYAGFDMEPDEKISADDAAVLIYTSGTTGTPKGVLLPQRALLNLCLYGEEILGITQEDRVSRNSTFSFDAALFEVFPFLLKGAGIYIVPREIKLNLAAINEFFEENRISVALFTTQIAEQFMQLENHSLRHLLAGGEKLRRFVEGRNYQLLNVYGPTETTVMATGCPVKEESPNIPIGRPFPNMRCHIRDSRQRMQPVGGRGEIVIGGLGVGIGYLNLPELTKERFIQEGEERIYKTGDYGYYRQDGNLIFCGRRDRQVKINGFRIEIGEIEKRMLDIERISDAVVLDFEDEAGNKFLCGYYTSAAELETKDLSEHLSDLLPGYMIPAYFMRLDEIPYTLNGKASRTGLPNPKKVLAKRGGKKPPSNEKQREILEIWKKVLEISDIGIEDDFFRIGGNSIKAIKVISEMSKNFKVDINQIFRYPTVSSLAEDVEYVQGYSQRMKEEVIRDQIREMSGEDRKRNEAEYAEYMKGIEALPQEKIRFDEKKYRELLLLGATGFLGSHLLYFLMRNTKAKITLIVRAEDPMQAKKKLTEVMLYYFEDLQPEDLDKLRILCGEAAKERFGLSGEEYRELCGSIDAVINSAANVHHYGEYQEFYGINAGLPRLLSDFALEGKKKEIHHISTVGVASGRVEGRKDILFREGDFDIGQKIENVYSKTKFLGEEQLLKTREKGLSVGIYRMGNLTGRRKDGFFQKNISENGFYKILKAMLSMGIMPAVEERTIDFSFIDEAAEAVIRLAFGEGISNRTFHLQNTNCISMKELGEYLIRLGFDIEMREYREYLDFLFENLRNPRYAEDIQTLLLHTHLEENVRLSKFIIACDETEKLLDRCGFRWSGVDEQILKKLISFEQAQSFFGVEKKEGEECLNESI